MMFDLMWMILFSCLWMNFVEKLRKMLIDMLISEVSILI